MENVYTLKLINQDQVVELPQDAELLGGSDACPNAMYSIGSNTLCLQAHPEQPLSSMRTFTRILLEEYHVEADTIEAAHATMAAGQPDAKLFADWISRFLTNATEKTSLRQ